MNACLLLPAQAELGKVWYWLDITLKWGGIQSNLAILTATVAYKRQRRPPATPLSDYMKIDNPQKVTCHCHLLHYLFNFLTP